MPEGTLDAGDRAHLAQLGLRVYERIRNLHIGLMQLELECFFLRPRRLPEDLVPLEQTIEPDGEGAIVRSGEWELRCRRDDAGWKVGLVGRRCQACATTGTCSSCSDAEPSTSCECCGSGLCPSCDGIGVRLFF